MHLAIFCDTITYAKENDMNTTEKEAKLIGTRIKDTREELGMAQKEVAEKINVAPSTIMRYEKGHILDVKIPVLESIARVLDVNPSWLLGYDVPKKVNRTASNLSSPAARPVPILGTICAGNGRICEQDFDGYFFIDSSVKADYCLHVEGDSMIDAEIYDGDIAFILADYNFQDGKIYAVMYGIDERASLKKIYREDDHLILMPCNSEYKPIIADPDDVCVIGECIGVYRGV